MLSNLHTMGGWEGGGSTVCVERIKQQEVITEMCVFFRHRDTVCAPIIEHIGTTPTELEKSNTQSGGF